MARMSLRKDIAKQDVIHADQDVIDLQLELAESIESLDRELKAKRVAERTPVMSYYPALDAFNDAIIYAAEIVVETKLDLVEALLRYDRKAVKLDTLERNQALNDYMMSQPIPAMVMPDLESSSGSESPASASAPVAGAFGRVQEDHESSDTSAVVSESQPELPNSDSDSELDEWMSIIHESPDDIRVLQANRNSNSKKRTADMAELDTDTDTDPIIHAPSPKRMALPFLKEWSDTRKEWSLEGQVQKNQSF
ncbi:uncharacterized protein DSM5745_04369 [Aspergillus mulundensis]|uniref:Uncharacterized protein n=1 Tax=Aspergillus mulundensis TaxID=1810919 RepID=A0A3D8SCN3_9EURO|nr:hypothetical protein DSM5745_04369 [Aspergillus mulundensis]RDW84043.1 hypothetical protein DSM5745_04369 [Aspergillus mulundensis]